MMGLFDGALGQNGWLGLSPMDGQLSQEARDAAYGFNRGTGQRMQNPNDRSSWIADALGSIPWRDMMTFQGPQQEQAPASVHPAYARLADAFGGAPSQPPMPPAPGMAQAIQNNPPPGMTPPAPQMPFGIRPDQFQGGFPPMPPQQQDATLPPNAQPTQGRAPQQIQPQAQAAIAQAQPEVGMGDRFSAFANNLSSGRNPIAMLANAAQGLSTGKRFDAEGVRQQNQAQVAQAVYQSLVARGYPPQVAMGMAHASGTDPKIAEKILGEAYAIPKTAEELAVRRASMPGSDQGQGNPFDILAQKSAVTSEGEAKGKSLAAGKLDLDPFIASSKEQLRLIGELRKHPGRNGIGFGTSAYVPPIYGTEAHAANALLDQIKSGEFLQEVKKMVGLGALSNAEGLKVTAAATRADRALSKPEMDKALTDLEGAVRTAMDAAHQRAGQQAPYGFQGNAVKGGNYDWSPGGGLKQRQ